MDLRVEHNIEVGHRISLPGKCQNIHGHSMWVVLTLKNLRMKGAIAGGYDFGLIKKHFREYLDTRFDHHLLLWHNDPWLYSIKHNHEWNWKDPREEQSHFVPGLTEVDYDPTVENIALDIRNWAVNNFLWSDVEVSIQETKTNGVTTS